MRNISLEELAKLFNDGLPFNVDKPIGNQGYVDVFNGALLLLYLDPHPTTIKQRKIIFKYEGDFRIIPSTSHYNNNQGFELKSNPQKFEYYFHKGTDCSVDSKSMITIPLYNDEKKIISFI